MKSGEASSGVVGVAWTFQWRTEPAAKPASAQESQCSQSLPVAPRCYPNKLGGASAGHQSYDIKAPEVCFIWTPSRI